MKYIISRFIWRDDHDNSFNQVALSSKKVLYLPHKSEYLTFVGHPSQQPEHPYWHHINTQSEGSLSYLWEIPLRTALRHPHWHQYLLVWGHQYPNCIHTSNTSILKMHPYWKHINTQTAPILATNLYPKYIHIPYRYNINTQTASISATHQLTQNTSISLQHQYPRCIHFGITSIP